MPSIFFKREHVDGLRIATACFIRRLRGFWRIRVSAFVIREVADFEDRSFALFGAKSHAISQIWQLVAECSGQNWDNEGAAPIDQLAATFAEDFIRAMPQNLPLPEFAPESDGSISLDWIQTRNSIVFAKRRNEPPVAIRMARRRGQGARCCSI